jgi:hypothetical protein
MHYPPYGLHYFIELKLGLESSICRLFLEEWGHGVKKINTTASSVYRNIQETAFNKWVEDTASD